MPLGANTLAVALLIAGAAGIVRGVTGFGGAMVMSPPLALLLGPRLTVPVVLVLESIVAAPMLLHTHTLVNWRLMGAILLAACVCVPLGTLVLVSLEPQLMRRAIALTVIVFAVILLIGWRYSGRQRLSTSVGLGALSGAMLGATSVGGPPVILYLLSGPDPVATTRANLTLYVTIASLAGLAALWYQDVFDVPAVVASLWLAPTYYFGLIAGTRVFPRLSDARFRQLTLLLLIAVSTGIVFA
jgi:uncharacterized membrane protein YfcA